MPEKDSKVENCSSCENLKVQIKNMEVGKVKSADALKNLKELSGNLQTELDLTKKENSTFKLKEVYSKDGVKKEHFDKISNLYPNWGELKEKEKLEAKDLLPNLFNESKDVITSNQNQFAPEQEQSSKVVSEVGIVNSSEYVKEYNKIKKEGGK